MNKDETAQQGNGFGDDHKGHLKPVRKEVIQPQVPLRLPCYDFTPIIPHTFGTCLPCGLAQ